MSVDVIVMSKPARATLDDDRNYTSADGSCKITLTQSADMIAVDSSRGRSFVSVDKSMVVVYSYYCPHRWNINEFARCLEGLESDIRRRDPRNLVVAGDFNAYAKEWGLASHDSRGGKLHSFAASLGLWVKNRGNTPTI